MARALNTKPRLSAMMAVRLGLRLFIKYDRPKTRDIAARAKGKVGKMNPVAKAPAHAVGFLLAVVLLHAAGGCTPGETITFGNLADRPRQLSGRLILPAKGQGLLPAVVMVHGTGGSMGRYEFYRDHFLSAGIATFEVDFKTGVFTGARDRPQVPTFLPFAFAALKALRANPAIDPDRIAIMGFSLGGHLAILAADGNRIDAWMDGQPGFSAHVGLYPGCKYLLQRLSKVMSPAPILIIAGSEDSLEDGIYCPSLKDDLEREGFKNLEMKIYPGVHHGFDSPRNSGLRTVYERSAVNQRLTLAWNDQAARDARKTAVNFIQRAFQGR